MRQFDMVDIDKAFELLWEKASAWPARAQTAPLEGAAGRIAAQDIVSSEYVPGFDRSAMDGYAVVSEDTAGASADAPVTLRMAGSIEMGMDAGINIAHGECAAIPTGGMLPAGADGIIKVELTETSDQSPGKVSILRPAIPGKNIARKGEDVVPGDVIVSKGSVLSPGKIGALAALGVTEVPVSAPLNIFLVSTGDELAPHGQAPGPGQVRDINAYSVAALANSFGFRVTGTALVKDDADLLRSVIRERLEGNDVICISGGSSVGEKDFTVDIIDEVTDGGIFTYGIRIKPGKPTILGWHEDTQTVVAGLPGYPTAAAMIFNVLFGRLSRAYAGAPEPVPVPAVLTEDARGGENSYRLQTVALSNGVGGMPEATPVEGAQSMITTLSRADGYFIIGGGREPAVKGAVVMVHPL